MTYCAAENTLSAIRQLSDLIENGHKDMSVSAKDREYLAIKQLEEEASFLADLCYELLEKHNE